MPDAFEQNILGAQNLIVSDTNKVLGNGTEEEGIIGDFEDTLDLPMEDQELLDLRDEWEQKHNGYYPKIKVRQEQNKAYYKGTQRQALGQNTTKVVSSNLIFESEETFIPQALSKNPEPVIWSDNTEEGKAASSDVKTMLQYHADVLCLRKKLGVMVRHWSIYFIGVVKHGYDLKVKDITTQLRKPQNFVLDPDGFIDEFGNFTGEFLGERIETTAKRLSEKFPKKEDFIFLKVNGKMGTRVVYTEWWTDEYCFTTYQDEVLDKHKNEFFNYDTTTKDTDEYGIESQTVTPGLNHFAVPKMPYTFLSVFSLQETPHDTTNLIEQSVPNQDNINDRDDQINKNLRTGNNSIALSGISFTSETAHEAAMALEDGDPVLVPDGQVENAIKRLPANPLPNGILESQQIDKDTLRSVFGTSGLVPNNQPDTAVRNNILAESHDSSRIGGGVGDALEQVADNIFNWWLQLYCVFYDEPHYAAIMGSGRAVEYVQLSNSNLSRKYVVSVAPNSMAPKDEISEQNQAIERWNNKAIDPIGLMKALNDPDPMESAKRLVVWSTNPQLYMQMFFPEAAPPPGVPQTEGGGDGSLEAEGTPPPTLGAPPADSALSQVPINNLGVPQ